MPKRSSPSSMKEHVKRLVSCYRDLEECWRQLEDYLVYDEWSGAPSDWELRQLHRSTNKGRELIEVIASTHSSIRDRFESDRPQGLWSAEAADEWQSEIADLITKSRYVYQYSSEAKVLLETTPDLLRKCWRQVLLLIDHLAEPSGERRSDSIGRVEWICTRFHRIALQLCSRHNDRATLEIEDEYDVQDLLHALLKLDFDDIRREEWTPSYAGSASRVDFMLKREGIVIEVKKIRRGLGARQVGEQLLIDIGRYREHPDCQTLVCFVYDAQLHIDNPYGLEADLGREREGIEIKVIIAPKGL